MIPSISVVLATRRRAHLLAPLVAAVLGDPATEEFVVVVDGPDDASMGTLAALAVRHPRLTAFDVPHMGQQRALDAAIARVGSEVVLTLDDDVLPDPGLVSGHARRHQDDEDLVVVGAMPVVIGSQDRASVGTRLYAEEYESRCRSWASGRADVLENLWGGNFSLRRRHAVAVGLHSGRYDHHYHADQDFGFRLAEAGLRGVFDPSLRAVHLHHRSNTSFLRDARRQGAAWGTLCQTHPGRAGAEHELAAVALAAATPAATPIAHSLLLGGTALRSVGVPGADVNAARLARRIMQRRGAGHS